MNPALRLGFGHALHAVRARLELELRVGAAAFNAADDFPESAVLALVGTQHLDLPTLLLGVTAVHSKQVAREERRLVAAGARANLEKEIALVVGIVRDQVSRQRVLERELLLGQRVEFLFAECPEFRVAAGLQFLGRTDVLIDRAPGFEIPGHGAETRVFAGELAEPLLIGDRRRIAQERFDVPVTLGQELEFFAD